MDWHEMKAKKENPKESIQPKRILLDGFDNEGKW